MDTGTRRSEVHRVRLEDMEPCTKNERCGRMGSLVHPVTGKPVCPDHYPNDTRSKA